MKKSVFLSYPKPFLESQKDFIEQLKKLLEDRQLVTHTLGVTDYDNNAPLVAIKKIMEECSGLITVAFKRTHINSGIGKPNSDINEIEYDVSDKWLTSPFCQIEPAMAFQLDLPVLIFREKGVLDEGILEKGVLGLYMPEFDLYDTSNPFFETLEFKSLIVKWENDLK